MNTVLPRPNSGCCASHFGIQKTLSHWRFTRFRSRYPYWRLDPKTIDIGSENVDWDCQRRFEFLLSLKSFYHTFNTHTILVVKLQTSPTPCPNRKRLQTLRYASRSADAVFTNRSRQLHSTLIHHAPPITPTMMRNVNIPAPALSLVVIGFVDVSGCVLGDVVPAFGSLAEVPPVLFVKGTMSGVKRFVPITLRAAI